MPDLLTDLFGCPLLARTRTDSRALTTGMKLIKLNAASEAVDVEEVLAELAGFSILKWETGNQAFRIHRLVREAIRERLPDEERGAILQSALLMVNSYLPDDLPPHDVRSWPTWEAMVAHVTELISEAVKARIGQPTNGLASMHVADLVVPFLHCLVEPEV